MTKDPFKVLGIDSTVSQSELYDAYSKLRQELDKQRFQPGDIGKDACDRLQEIEEAYKDCMQILEDRYYIDNSEEVLDHVENLIKEKKYDEAQSELTKLNRRSARWHYLQSGIYYQKSWHNDAKREIELALDLDPTNQKYKETLAGIEKIMQGKSSYHSNFYGNPDNSKETYQNVSYRKGGGPDICDCCSSLICADCCCECMGGDLITCC